MTGNGKMSDERNGSSLLECDLVMRGGITSGIVYPKAVAELSKTYRFRSIGGTSAGAIAASVTAAAEYGRQRILSVGRTDFADAPFRSVSKIPEELADRNGRGGRTRLLRLFQPQKKTAPLLKLVLAATSAAAQKAEETKGGQQNDRFEDRAFVIGKAMVNAFPLASFIGAFPGFLLGMSIVAGLTRYYWEGVSGQTLISQPSTDTTLFGLTVTDALAWILSSSAMMIFLIGLCVGAIWFSKRLMTAVAALAFAMPLGLWLHLQYLGLLGISLTGADNFSAFSIQFGLVIAEFSALVGSLLASAFMTVRRISTAIPANMYGLCTGLTAGKNNGTAGVTDWLHQFIQRVAGRTAEEKPLTAGDLWRPQGYNGFDDIAEGRRDIELSLMVTNVTRGISHRFPFLEGWRGSLYFRHSDFMRLFPRPVVEHMIQHAQLAEKDVALPKGFCRLPPAKDLPIVFGARMSMAYPFLLSAVPLYAVDWSRQGANGQYNLKRCWFSDGGLTSNFPINLFDRPLPSRPTFGINLVPDTARHFEVALPEAQEGPVRKMNFEAYDFEARSLRKVVRNESDEKSADSGSEKELWDDIWMPRRNDQDLFKVIRFNDFEGKKGSVSGFFEALFDTARNWADTELTHMPGYRDRIVHVELKPNEGGLNLDMAKDVIERVGEKGRLAGKLLAARFDPQPGPDPQNDEEIELDWENHRWVRYRSTMAALEHVARDLVGRLRVHPDQPATRTYQEMLEDSLDTTSHYRWASREQYLFARQATADLSVIIGQWLREYETFDRVYGHNDPLNDGLSPRPKAILKIVPPSDADPRNEHVSRF